MEETARVVGLHEQTDISTVKT